MAEDAAAAAARARIADLSFFFLSVTVLCVFCGWAYIFLRLGGRAWMRRFLSTSCACVKHDHFE